jgi:hypothetical protein
LFFAPASLTHESGHDLLKGWKNGICSLATTTTGGFACFCACHVTPDLAHCSKWKPKSKHPNIVGCGPTNKSRKKRGVESVHQSGPEPTPRLHVLHVCVWSPQGQSISSSPPASSTRPLAYLILIHATIGYIYIY